MSWLQDLGEAAGIAGLLSLAGQALQAASTIYNFVRKYRNHEGLCEVPSALLGLLRLSVHFANGQTKRSLSTASDALKLLLRICEFNFVDAHMIK